MRLAVPGSWFSPPFHPEAAVSRAYGILRLHSVPDALRPPGAPHWPRRCILGDWRNGPHGNLPLRARIPIRGILPRECGGGHSSLLPASGRRGRVADVEGPDSSSKDRWNRRQTAGPGFRVCETYQPAWGAPGSPARVAGLREVLRQVLARLHAQRRVGRQDLHERFLRHHARRISGSVSGRPGDEGVHGWIPARCLSAERPSKGGNQTGPAIGDDFRDAGWQRRRGVRERGECQSGSIPGRGPLPENDVLAMRAPLWTDPGGGYFYSNLGAHVLSVLVHRITGKAMQYYIREKLAGPMGWGPWGYPPPADGAAPPANTPGAGGIAVRATDMLRFAYVLLHRGNWRGLQLIPSGYVELCSKPSPYDPHAPYRSEEHTSEL